MLEVIVCEKACIHVLIQKLSQFQHHLVLNHLINLEKALIPYLEMDLSVVQIYNDYIQKSLFLKLFTQLFKIY